MLTPIIILLLLLFLLLQKTQGYDKFNLPHRKPTGRKVGFHNLVSVQRYQKEGYVPGRPVGNAARTNRNGKMLPSQHSIDAYKQKIQMKFQKRREMMQQPQEMMQQPQEMMQQPQEMKANNDIQAGSYNEEVEKEMMDKYGLGH